MNWLKRISFKKNRALKWLYFAINIVCAHLLGKPLILCFHRVKIPSGSLLDRRIGVTKPSDLEEVIRFLTMAGYKFVPLERLVQMIEEGNFSKVAAVTFDDGLNDLYENAFPIMKKYSVPFTCFLITSLIDSTKLLWLHQLYISWDKIDKQVRDDIIRDYIEVNNLTKSDETVAHFVVHFNDPYRLMEVAIKLSDVAKINCEDEEHIARDLYLSSEAIEEMQANGLKIELHGHKHWPMASLSEEETSRELETSSMMIKAKFQSHAQFLALPYGKSNPYLNAIARQLGIIGIFTMQGKLITKHNKDLYSLPRFCIYDDVQAFYRELSVEFVKYIVAKFSKN
jgi:peptidoglycan/xylan/chitin deacetylase (PgdA/CDA1 family)